MRRLYFLGYMYTDEDEPVEQEMEDTEGGEIIAGTQSLSRQKGVRN